MAAAVVTNITKFNTQQIMPVFISFYKTTASDWLVTNSAEPGFRGFLPLAGWNFSATAVNTATDIDFGLCLINNTGTAYTATDTTLAVDGIAPVATRVCPYYLLLQDASTTTFEIVEVTADSTPTSSTSNLTVKRGCLGTTASAAVVANNSYCYFLNVLVFTDSEIGNNIVWGIPLPNEPKARVFGSGSR